MAHPTRRAVQSFCLLVLATACSSNPEGLPPVQDAGPTLAAQRAACAFGAGDLPAKTLRDFPALDSGIPIDHIVLIMQENRSFDHYYSSLTVSGQTVDGASPTATNPDPTTPGGTISRFHQTNVCFTNPNEGWDTYHHDVDDGGMDGFTAANVSDSDPTGSLVMGYYDQSDLPFYYALAQTFTISDRHFCSTLGPTWPNRLFYMAGTSFGVITDDFPPSQDPKGNPYPNLFTQLNGAGISWNFYAETPLLPTLGILFTTLSSNRSHVASRDQFFSDVDAGTLAAVTFVESSDLAGGVSPDEHPPADVEVGQAAVAQVVQTLMTSSFWPTTALFITYDEAGGMYDHVVPPPACIPDDIPLAFSQKAGTWPAVQNQYGIRVPFFAVSPYAKRGYVSHQVTDHASILRFIQARFGLPAMTHRDANAEPPFDMFDFSAPDLTIPSLPVPTIDAAKQSACASQFPPP